MQGSGMTGAGRTDVLISGAGFAGLALGAALAGAGLSVMIVDPSLGRPSGFDPRASTLVAGTRRLLEAIGAWDAIAPDAEPMLGMEITDGRLEQILRPVFLQIHGEAAPGEPFAHVAPNGLTKAALLATAERAGVHLAAGRIADLRQVEGGADAVLADGSTISARLVVAADGAQSTLRGMAGIASRGWRYDQSAIVTNVRLEKPHHGIAVQHFLEGGPLALLPLRGERASIVWSERKFQALRLAELDDAGFRDALQKRAGHRFGQIDLDGRRALRPLEFRLAADFARGRVALVGDAAHAIHPIAGQGLNLGLRDVAALAESVVDAARLGQDIGSDAVLARYSGWRRFDTALMTGAMDGLVQLFTTRSGPVRLLRDIGLGLVDRMPTAKRAFIRSAAGLGGEVPRLMRGETL